MIGDVRRLENRSVTDHVRIVDALRSFRSRTQNRMVEPEGIASVRAEPRARRPSRSIAFDRRRASLLTRAIPCTRYKRTWRRVRRGSADQCSDQDSWPAFDELRPLVHQELPEALLAAGLIVPRDVGGADLDPVDGRTGRSDGRPHCPCRWVRAKAQPVGVRRRGVPECLPPGSGCSIAWTKPAFASSSISRLGLVALHSPSTAASDSNAVNASISSRTRLPPPLGGACASRAGSRPRCPGRRGSAGRATVRRRSR